MSAKPISRLDQAAADAASVFAASHYLVLGPNTATPAESGLPLRRSDFLNKRQFDQLDHSIRFASEIGLPLNTMTTIQFGATACEPEDVGPAFRRLIRRYFTPWLRPTRAYPFDHRPAAWYYVVENVHEHDHHPHGTHVHWVVHIPEGRRHAFESKLPHWVRRVAGEIFDATTAIDVRDAEKPRGTARYLGKALRPHDAKRRGIRPSPQGLVHGRRLSISEAINVTAINAHRDRLRAATTSSVDSSVADVPTTPWPANDADGYADPPWHTA